jgi:hypothetical protein
LAHGVFHVVEAHRQIAGVVLRRLARLALALLRGLIATAEQIVEKAGALLLRRSGAGQQQRRKCYERENAAT